MSNFLLAHSSIPGLKKQISKLSQLQEDCDKREKENEKKSADFRNEFLRSCHQLGIAGDRPRKEIIALLDDLPKIYSGVTDDCRKLKQAIDFYRNFVANPDIELLPTLKVRFFLLISFLRTRPDFQPLYLLLGPWCTA